MMQFTSLRTSHGAAPRVAGARERAEPRVAVYQCRRRAHGDPADSLPVSRTRFHINRTSRSPPRICNRTTGCPWNERRRPRPVGPDAEPPGYGSSRRGPCLRASVPPPAGSARRGPRGQVGDPLGSLLRLVDEAVHDDAGQRLGRVEADPLGRLPSLPPHRRAPWEAAHRGMNVPAPGLLTGASRSAPDPSVRNRRSRRRTAPPGRSGYGPRVETRGAGDRVPHGVNPDGYGSRPAQTAPPPNPSPGPPGTGPGHSGSGSHTEPRRRVQDENLNAASAQPGRLTSPQSGHRNTATSALTCRPSCRTNTPVGEPPSSRRSTFCSHRSRFLTKWPSLPRERGVNDVVLAPDRARHVEWISPTPRLTQQPLHDQRAAD